MDPRATPASEFSIPEAQPIDPFPPMGLAPGARTTTMPITIPASAIRPIVDEGFEDSPPPATIPEKSRPGLAYIPGFRD